MPGGVGAGGEKPPATRLYLRVWPLDSSTSLQGEKEKLMKLSAALEGWPGQRKETLTVAGLIKVLSRYDGSLPVVATWEGVTCPVQKYNISISKRRYPITGYEFFTGVMSS